MITVCFRTRDLGSFCRSALIKVRQRLPNTIPSYKFARKVENGKWVTSALAVLGRPTSSLGGCKCTPLSQPGTVNLQCEKSPSGNAPNGVGPGEKIQGPRSKRQRNPKRPNSKSQKIDFPSPPRFRCPQGDDRFAICGPNSKSQIDSLAPARSARSGALPLANSFRRALSTVRP